MLPPFLRQARMIAWVKSLCFPIADLYDVWKANRTENLYRLTHNSQVCYLRAALNRDFDAQQKRIRISEGNQNKYQYIYLQNVQPRFLGTMYLYQDSDYADTGVDFVVEVPQGLLYDEYKMKKTINFYKLPSKRYKIETYS